jgi:hypothetical protein
VVSLWCVTLLGSIAYSRLLKVLGYLTMINKYKSKAFKKNTILGFSITSSYKRIMINGEDM